MKLELGITGANRYWETILKQIGVPFHVMNANDSMYDFASVILTQDISLQHQAQLFPYSNDGGTVLAEADIAQRFFKMPTKRVYIKYLYPHNSVIFSYLPPCDVFKYCMVADQSNLLPNQQGVFTCKEQVIGKGKIIVFPAGFTALLYDSSTKRKNFYSRYAKKETNERVSLVSKGSVRYYVQAALEHLFHFRGFPFVNLWHIPHGEKSIFSFRIDTDFGKRNQIIELYNVCRKHNISASWFVETRSSKEWIQQFSEFQNQEIGLHCYRHKVFNNFQQNYDSLHEGLAILKYAGLHPVGFAAPYGEWNEMLAKAIRTLNFTYSSEFGFAYDSLPFHTYANGSHSASLQIPIHPISFGRLSAGKHSEEEIVKYYFDIIVQKLKLFEPIIFYTHPSEQRFNILDKIFSKIHELNIPVYPLKDYAIWWEKRDSVNFSFSFDNGNIRIKSNNPNSSVWYRTSFPNGKITLSQYFSERSSEKILEPVIFDFYDNSTYKKLRKTTLRMIWHDILHFYRKKKQ